MQAQTAKLQTKLKMQHFVKQVPSNLKTPCLISKVACNSINNGGTCQDGTCDNKDCQNNPNSPACKWKNEKEMLS